MLKTFPIKLVYTVRDEAVPLVAVFHARRQVASRKESSHEPCMSSIPAAATNFPNFGPLCMVRAAHPRTEMGRLSGEALWPCPRALVHAWSPPLQVVGRTGRFAVEAGRALSPRGSGYERPG